MNSFPAKFTSLLIAFAMSCFTLYIGGGLSLSFIGSVLPEFGVMAIIYVIGLVISPFITLSIYKGGKWITFFYGLIFVLLTSGAVYILLPFFEVVSNPAIACAACTFFPVLSYTSYHGVTLLKRSACPECATALSMRGFSAAAINKKVFYKGAFFGFMGDTYKILGYIVLIYLPAQVIGRYNGIGMKILTQRGISLAALSAVCALIMLTGAAGVLAERIFAGTTVCREDWE